MKGPYLAMTVENTSQNERVNKMVIRWVMIDDRVAAFLRLHNCSVSSCRLFVLVLALILANPFVHGAGRPTPPSFSYLALGI